MVPADPNEMQSDVDLPEDDDLFAMAEEDLPLGIEEPPAPFVEDEQSVETLPLEAPPAGGGLDLDEDVLNFAEIANAQNTLESAASEMEVLDLLGIDAATEAPRIETDQYAEPGPADPQYEYAQVSDEYGVLQPLAPGAAPELVLQPISSRVTWIGIASVLAANLLLLLFAWNASSSLHAHLGNMREELAAIKRDSGHAVNETTSEPAREERPEGGFHPLPMSYENNAEAAPVRLAENEIAHGLYLQARQRLYRFLANVDRLEREARVELEAKANYLVAFSYLAESESERGDG